MRNPGGWSASFGPDGVIEEHDTFTCAHCNRIVTVKHGCRPEDLGGHCKVCDKLICADCVKTGRCEPFEKKLEGWEARERLRREAGGA